MNKQYVWEKDGYILRLAEITDAKKYYQQNFNPLDCEVARLTGSKSIFTEQEVTSYFKQCLTSNDRYDFVIVSSQGYIIGETVINEIDEITRCANFRVGLFQRQLCDKGIGTWAIQKTLQFAFEVLPLHQILLEVFSFNERAIHVYKKLGFQQVKILKNKIKDSSNYADIIVMEISKNKWKTM